MKIWGVVLTIIVVFALLASLGIANANFSLVDYIDGFESVRDFPNIPNLYIGDGNIFEQTKNFFVFIGNLLAYPFYVILYLVDVVKVIFGGLTL